MPAQNPNDFDFFSKGGEVLPILLGKISAHEFDFWNKNNEAFLTVNQSVAAPAPAPTTVRRRIFIVD